MATHPPVLSQERRDSGAKLLQLTDDIGFGAVGAAWSHDRETGRWAFILVSPMIDSQGPLWVYERLLKVFKKFPLPSGITPLDIAIASPREAFFTKFPVRSVEADNLEMLFELRDAIFHGMTLDYMAVYRMRPVPQNAGDRARAFDSRVLELLAA